MILKYAMAFLLFIAVGFAIYFFVCSLCKKKLLKCIVTILLCALVGLWIAKGLGMFRQVSVSPAIVEDNSLYDGSKNDPNLK